MDADRFDGMLRWLTTSPSRRQALGGVLGAVLGGVWGNAGTASAAKAK